jgi:hypothetical protein
MDLLYGGKLEVRPLLYTGAGSPSGRRRGAVAAAQQRLYSLLSALSNLLPPETHGREVEKYVRVASGTIGINTTSFRGVQRTGRCFRGISATIEHQPTEGGVI